MFMMMIMIMLMMVMMAMGAVFMISDLGTVFASAGCTHDGKLIVDT